MAIKKMNGVRIVDEEVYHLDASGHVMSLTESGVRIEAESRAVAGGMFELPDDPAKPVSVAVLVAPSMPNRFKSVEVNGEGVYLIRTDGARCEVTCHPLVAEEVATRQTILVSEAYGHSNGLIERYEIVVDAETTPTMRM